MKQPLPSAPPIEPSSAPITNAWRALCLLHEAWETARAENQDVWQFAVEIGQLRALGLGHSQLRLLLCRGLLEHALENTEASAGRRTFRPLKALVLPEQSCFVLTAKGLAEILEQATEIASQLPAPQQCESISPRWDGAERQLWWGDSLVKAFRVPAANQQRVLEALQEEDWPARIDDPLPLSAGIDPRARLHDTLKALNRHHRYRILRFRGDGEGRGILWSIVPGPGHAMRGREEGHDSIIGNAQAPR